MTVSLAQHERDAPRERRHADRPGDIATAPHYRVRLQLAKQRTRAHTSRRQRAAAHARRAAGLSD